MMSGRWQKLKMAFATASIQISGFPVHEWTRWQAASKYGTNRNRNRNTNTNTDTDTNKNKITDTNTDVKYTIYVSVFVCDPNLLVTSARVEEDAKATWKYCTLGFGFILPFKITPYKYSNNQNIQIFKIFKILPFKITPYKYSDNQNIENIQIFKYSRYCRLKSHHISIQTIKI